jgi:putative acetyltransferase
MLKTRKERPYDTLGIHGVNAAAFGQEAEARLVDALRQNNALTLSLVAELKGVIIGHIAFSPVTIDDGKTALQAVGLAPMAVLPQFQKKGIGSQLVKEGLEELKRSGHMAVVVLGHPHYYPRFGFVPANNFNIRCEYDAPPEAFMALELRPDALKGVSGFARYRPEFKEV